MEQLVNFIIRPPRADYSPKHDLLDEEFMLKGRMFRRKDLQVKNGQGLTLRCSHYLPCQLPEGNALPCVIYCHGNSGCRADASEAAIILLPSNITVFTLDFSGSGLSEGEHVTLGWNEKEDLRAVVDYLRKDGNVSCIGLWGRSMGAVTSLLYGVEDPSIAGMVLDSPFSNLVGLMMELVDTYKYPLPKFTVKLAIQHMRRVIKKKANFDIMDLDTVQVAKCSFVPALFGHATDDDFIRPHHSDQIYDSYTGDKNIIKFDGDHNSPRPQFYFDSITIFFHNVLNPPKGAYDELFYHTNTMHDYFHQDHWGAVNDLDHNSHDVMLPSFEPTIVSTEDAINQVRQRRPMSRTDVPSDISHQDRLPGTGVEKSTSDLHPSSSRVINNSPVAACPTSADEKYWEYSIGSSFDMPSSTEDEERMLTEAILMSLKDSGIAKTNEDQTSCEDGHKDSTPCAIDRPTISSNSADVAVPVEPSSHNSTSDPAVSTNTAHANKSPSGNTHNTLDASISTHEPDPVTATAAKLVMQKNAPGHTLDKSPNGNVHNTFDASSSTHETDAVAGTTAKLVVQKSVSGHIFDGLAQKWSNLFKSSG